MKAYLSFGLFVLISIAVVGQKNKPIHVLIVDGFSNHDWKQTTTLIKWILERNGRFIVDVATLPTDTTKREAWKPDFTKYGVVIQNTNNLNTPALRWSSFAEKALEKYVKKGGGLFILHSANNSFSQWPEYEKMIGMGWRPRTFGYALKIDSNKNIVRIPQSYSKWYIQPLQKGQVQIEYILQVDPGGMVPAWLINLFAARGPFESFKNLRKQVKKDIYNRVKIDFITD